MKKLLKGSLGAIIAVWIMLMLGLPFGGAAQTPAFPGAEGFGRFSQGARGHASPEVYIVNNLNDSGPGSFRDAVSQPGRFVVFSVGGVIRLQSRLIISSNTTIAGQTAPGDGIVVYGRGISYSGAEHVITRYMRFRCGVDNGAGRNEDALGIANGHNMIFDHLSVSWGIDEVFSINWDNRGTDPDNITIQNTIIGQGLHRHNHSAGGLMEPGGKVSIVKSLYHSNKTRNPKVKGINEFVNNVVYNFGNAGNEYEHTVSGDGYIMGGSASTSHVNIVNNYFIAGPHTPSKTTPFSRGTPTFHLYASGNYWDGNKDGVLNGTLVPADATGYPGIEPANFQSEAYDYPYTANALTAEQAYDWVLANVGANFPRRDEIDQMFIEELGSIGTQAAYVYRESDLPFANGGLGVVDGAPAPTDTDGDGIPDEWEDANGLDKNDPADALAESDIDPNYLNIEVYINSLVDGEAPDFIRPPSQIALAAESEEEPASSTITVTWSDNGHETGTIVIERSEDGETYTEVAQVAVGIETYTDADGVLPNQTYHYRLKIATDDEESSYVFRSVTTPPIPTAPEAPSQPSPSHEDAYADLTEGGTVEVRWQGSENTERYVVYFGESEAALTQVAEVASPDERAHALNGLAAGQMYYWRVDAVNDKGVATGAVWSFRVAPVIETGLAGYWAFDEEEGAEVQDGSSFAHHGLLGTDDVSQVRVKGILGGAIDLETVDQTSYPMSIPHADHLHFGRSSFSISFWMKGGSADLPPDNNSSAYILCKGSITRNDATGATGKRVNIELKNNQFRFAIDDDNDANGGGKDEVQTDGVPFFNEEWVHVVALRDTESGQLRVYRNGQQVGQTAIQRALSSIGEDSDLVIGNIGEYEFLDSQNASAPYTGQLDELRIFNHVLSLQEIQEEYARGAGLQKVNTPTPEDGQRTSEPDRVEVSWMGGVLAEKFVVYLGADENNLQQHTELAADQFSYTYEGLQPESTYYWRVDAVAGEEVAEGDVWTFQTVSGVPETGELVVHFRLNETSGTTVNDSSPFGNHGTLRDFGSEYWITDGQQGGAIRYDATTPEGGIVVPAADQYTFDDNSFTISVWMRSPENTYTPSSNNAYLVSKGTFGGVGKWYGLQLNHASRVVFAVDDNITKSEVVVDVADVELYNNEWRHIVAVRDRSAEKLLLYIDGELVKEADDRTFEGIGQADLDLLIGNSVENRPYRDDLDEVRMYNYALSPAAIADLFEGREEKALVAHYRLDEQSGTVAHDSSPNANHGVLQELSEEPWIGDGQRGGAIKVDAVAPTGGIVVPAIEQNAFDESSFSISLWMRAAENTYTPGDNNAYLISKGTFGGVGKWYGIQLHHNNRVVFAVDDNAVKSEVFADVEEVGLYSGAWKHVVAVRDRDEQKLLLYIDGELVKEGNDGTVGGIAQQDLDLLIGNSVEEKPYRDDLDDVRLYNYALSSEEVGALFEGWADRELVAHYRLDETSGTVAHDATPFANHGTLQDFGDDPWVSGGKRGGALHYTTTEPTGGIVVPAAAQNAFDQHSFTMSLWMRADENTYGPTSATNAYLIHKGAFASAEGGKWYGIQLHHNGNINFSIDDNVVKTDASANANDVGLFSGEWKHVVAVRDRDAGKTKLYVDGVLVGEAEDKTTEGISMPGMDLTIGNSRENRPYRDDLDDVRLYNYALSEDEILELFDPPLEAVQPVAHYKLDETSGTVATDSSPNANHGTLRDFGPTPWIGGGKEGGALHYTTTAPTGGIAVPAAGHNAFDQRSFTISLWMRAAENTYTESAQNAYLISKGTFGGVGKWYGIQLHHNGRIVFAVDDNVVKSEVFAAVDDVNLYSGEWKHVVAVRDRDDEKLKLYIDGELVKEGDDRTVEGIAQSDLELIIGNSVEEKPYRDDLDDVRLYDFALSPIQIQSLFQSQPVVRQVRNISPENETQDVLVGGTTFVWEGHVSAYTLRLGTAIGDLAPVVEETDVQSYTLTEPLDHGTTYYWQVDALVGDVWEAGEIWSFETEPLAVPMIINEEILEVNQYSEAGLVIAQLTADNAPGEVLTDWRISTNTDVNANGVDAFALDAETGELRINDASDFEYEEGRILEVGVRVSNSLGESDEAIIQVVVNFVNTPPSFDAIESVVHCYSPEEQTIQITGINPGLEAGQTVELSLNAHPSRMFHTLEITQPEDGVAYLRYTPKVGIDDAVEVTITATDNGGAEHGGQDSYAQIFTLLIAAQPDISILADKQRVQKGETVRFEVRNNARHPVTLTWTYDEHTFETDRLIAHFAETTTVTVKAVNEAGCEDEASITIEVYEPAELEASNVITPNGDGINDTWVVKNIGYYPNNTVKVYDISGRAVYQANGYQNNWNGSYQGRPLADGTYYFIIEYGDGRQPQKGYINIINDNR